MKIFLVSYGGGHVAMLAPAAKRLAERGHEVIFLALTTARQYLEKHKIPCIGFKDLLFLADADAPESGKKLAAEIPENSVVSIEETIAYLGMSFSDLVYEKGAEEAEKLYAKQQRQAFFPVRTLKKVLEYYKPDVVVATNSPRSERAAIVAAGELGIPSVCVVDLFAIQERKWIGVKGFANRVCVLNDAVKEMFVECGRGDDELVVTGNPAFDVLLTDSAHEAGAKMREQRGWDDGKINILFASQPEPEKHPFNSKIGNVELPDEIEDVLRKFVVENAGYRLVIRYHPSQNCNFKAQKNVELSTQEDEISLVLYAVDMVITITSTVAVQASLVGKPVITIEKSIFSDDMSYAKMGISVGVKNWQELTDAIFREKNNVDDYVAESCVKHGVGRAVDRVVAVIEGLGTGH